MTGNFITATGGLICNLDFEIKKGAASAVPFLFFTAPDIFAESFH